MDDAVAFCGGIDMTADRWDTRAHRDGDPCRVRPDGSPYGPFTFRGTVLEPVQGWTTHHSILQLGDRWCLFYHDTELSGRTHLRNAKATELTHRADGTIETVDPFLR